mgnify:CR=1 FL=1
MTFHSVSRHVVRLLPMPSVRSEDQPTQNRTMSATEIIAELPKLSSRERQQILDRLLKLDGEAEMLEERRHCADEAFQVLDALEAEDAQTSPTLVEMLLRHAGKAVGLPEDMAAHHDHYLHATPKR